MPIPEPHLVPDHRRAGFAVANRRSHRWPLWCALLVISAAAAFLIVPALTEVPARLTEGCSTWIAIAGGLELLSAVGFTVLFKLVFAAPIGWRRSTPAALRALGASTVLPAGGLVGPTVGAWSASNERPSLSELSRSTVTFLILANAPGVVALAGLGTLLWLGVPSGPHGLALTILPASLAVVLLTATWLAGQSSRRKSSPPRRAMISRTLAMPARTMIDGVVEAHTLVTAGNWKLVGAFGYYAFDNAVLWAAFHAYGHTPRIGVVVMGYLVGSLAGALPVPAGLGALDGGLIGALVLYGSPAAPAAAAVFLYRGISLSVPVVLGAIGCTCGRGNRQLHVAPRRPKRRPVPELVRAQLDRQ
jgi:uncharacterized membrane protein YbhN (UPF0104 family)